MIKAKQNNYFGKMRNFWILTQVVHKITTVF